MTALSWTLGLLSIAAGIGWLVLTLFGNSFRSSFGASPVALLTRTSPLMVTALVVATVAMPHNKGLLHATALVLAAACVGLAFVLRESVFVSAVGFAYCAAWFVFYARSL